MGKTEKKINKWLIGAIIGSAILGGSMAMSPKGRSLRARIVGKAKKWGHILYTGWSTLRKATKKKSS